MSYKKLKVSVIIPIFNDEEYVADCLNALSDQTCKPYEVIIVDNNCTDSSMLIAKRFNFVKIIQEKTQGLTIARNTGYSNASGDILVRIDADTIVPINYIENLQKIFSNKSVGAVTGYGVSRFELVSGMSKIWTWFYFAYTNAFLGHSILFGANNAFRAKYWKNIKDNLILDDKLVHEDQDISLALASVGVASKVNKSITVSVDMTNIQQYEVFKNYLLRLRNLKRIDKTLPRYKFESRLKPTFWLKRAILWIASAWTIYFYLGILYLRYTVQGMRKFIFDSF
jgi:glycosyltransferase involved in cell wall biosynthesis